MRKKNNKGFTLVELLAVVIVLIIIIFIAINKIKSSTQKTKMNTVKANAITYIKAVNDLASVDSLTSVKMKNIAASKDVLESYGLKVNGEQPRTANVILSDFEVTYACVEYGSYYIVFKNGKYDNVKRGKCGINDVENTGVLAEYEYTGEYDTFTAPYGGYYYIELWGAASGSPWTNSETGSGGAYTSGKIYLNTGDILYFYIGQQGSYGSGSNSYGGPVGGYNGGGSGGNYGSGSGGGSTDVRLVSGSWDDEASLASRIMVAAGGGGSDDGPSATNDGRGGGGGELQGICAWYGGTCKLDYAATQTSGGAFGKGANVTSNTDTGGAGGGYWGGKATNYGNGGGGGGSSFISGYTGCVAIAAEDDTTPRLNSNGDLCANGTTDNLCSVHYSGLVFKDGKMLGANKLIPNFTTGQEQRGNLDNGHARVTYTAF